MRRNVVIALTIVASLAASPSSALAEQLYAAAPQSPFPVGSVPRSVAVADLDLDGYPDLAVANSNSHDISILFGQGAGQFGLETRMAVGTRPSEILAADFNGDDLTDLATANAGSSNLSILLGDGLGGFTPAPGSPEPVGGSPQALVATDTDADGALDLVAATEGEEGLAILKGDGTGDFALSATELPDTPNSPRDVLAADLDGDLDVDLAVLDGSSAVLTLLLGDGTGAFVQAPTPIAVGGTQPAAAAVWDLNGDTRLDFAVALRASDALGVTLAKETGGYATAPGSPLAAPKAPLGVAAGDLDRNNTPDLVVAGGEPGELRILAGAGDGTFSPSASLAAGTKPTAVAIADVDVNGQPDLVVTDAVTTGSVRVFLNTVAAVFPTYTPPQEDPPAPRAESPREERQELHPDLAETVLVEPEFGEVLVRTPGSQGFVPLQALTEVPVGTVVDSRRGRVALTSVGDLEGGEQSADFFAGSFRVRQRRARVPITDLILTGELDCTTGRNPRGDRRRGGDRRGGDRRGERGPKASSAARRRRAARRLWGDGHGRFRTSGRYSSATVRGTRWLTEDRCDGTLVRVRRGVVNVRDFTRNRTVQVKAGRAYLARPGR